MSTAEEIALAVETARELARAGVPIFLARPATDDKGQWRPDGGHGGCGYWLPGGWEQTEADPDVLNDWVPGMAVCAVMGVKVDALDVDPRNGGDATKAGMHAAGIWPVSYAEAATPSGGTHDLVAPLGVRSKDGLQAGLDVKAGEPGGGGRGFVFIAPTTKRSKTSGEVSQYRWIRPPDLELLAEETAGDDSGASLAAMIRESRRPDRLEDSEPYTGPPFADLDPSEQASIRRWVAGAVEGITDELRASASWTPGFEDSKDRGWERLQADMAWRLGRLARASWNDLTMAQAEQAFTSAAPTDAGWAMDHVADKWASQSNRKSAAPYPTTLRTEAEFLASLPQPTVLEGASAPLGEQHRDTPATDRRSVATQLVDLALSRWRFGISPEGDAFALPLDGAQVVRMLTGSRSIRAELADLFQDQTGKVAGQQALADAVLVLEGRARRTDPVPLALRVAYVEGAAWLDLGTLTGEAVRVTPAGWEVVEAPPILFRRTALSGTLPEPVAGGDLAELWGLLNVVPASRPVLLAWLVAALLPEIPHPIATLVGEQGTGKSTASRMLAGLLDPSPAQLRKPPRDVDAWVTAAAGSWLVAVDNISTVADWWSEALCRAVTGDGDVRRRLYSDADLHVFSFRRVVLVNGIDLGAVRDDLAERLLTVELHRITERRYDVDLSTAWEQAHPRILGALLDLAAQVLKVLPDVVVEDPPRMADFGRLLAAVDLVHGTDGLATYKALAGDLAADAVTSDSTLTAITETIREPWEGTAAELLAQLGEGPKGDKSWPKNARAMTTVLRRRAPSLRRLDWTVDDLGRHGKANAIRFLVSPPTGQKQGGERAARGRRGERQASDTDLCHSPRDTTLTCANVKTTSEASDASVKPVNLLLDQMKEREERGEGGDVREGAVSTLASPPPARDASTVRGRTCSSCAGSLDDQPPGIRCCATCADATTARARAEYERVNR